MRKLLYIWEVMIICCLVSLGFFNSGNSIYSLVLVTAVSVQLIYELYKRTAKDNDKIFLYMSMLALIIRLAVMYYDVNIFEIDMGDCRDFRLSGEKFFYTNQIDFRGKFSLTTVFFGLLCKIFGPQRITIQFVGIVCFIIAAYITYEILSMIGIRKYIKNIVMAWMLFTPQNIINTSISNREAIVILAVAISLNCFVKWYYGQRLNNLVFAFIWCLFGTIFHAGIIGLVAGYVVALVFYKKREDGLMFKLSSMIYLVLILLFFLFLYNNFNSIFFAKFGAIESLTDITRSAITNEEVMGATYYIPGGGTDNIKEMIFYSPLRAAYFQLSPMPWYWRGIGDALAFIICSLPHLIWMIKGIWIICQRKKFERKEISLIIILIISAICISGVFGWGT